jgi:hypothetical protein
MMPATNAQENEMDDQTPFISSADPLLASRFEPGASSQPVRRALKPKVGAWGQPLQSYNDAVEVVLYDEIRCGSEPAFAGFRVAVAVAALQRALRMCLLVRRLRTPCTEHGDHLRL